MRNVDYRVVLAVILAFCVTRMAHGQRNPYGVIPVASLDEPYLILIRDSVVHRALDLTDEQALAITGLTDELDPLLWRTRNQPPQKSGEEIRKLTKTAEQRMSDILSFAQRKRMDQIRFRVAGMGILLGDEVGEKLSLSAEQDSKIEKVIQQAEKAADQLRVEAQKSEQGEQILLKAARIAFEQDRRIAAILSRDQRARLRAMLGSPIEVWRLGRVKFKTPALCESDGWVNSKPLTFAELRGKVAAVHFWTYGNLACVHDYPVHRDWQTKFGEKGLTIIGIHTPQTKEECDSGRVREKASDVGLTFPILIDNARENWNAWGNSVWPGVYLVDKQGSVRYWWLGELSANDGQGEKLMRLRIEELLAEE